MDIDPNTGMVGGGSLLGLGAIWYWFKNLRRADEKADMVDGGWKEIVAALKAEVQRLHDDVSALKKVVYDCEEERTKLMVRLSAFERRFGTRDGEGYAPGAGRDGYPTN